MANINNSYLSLEISEIVGKYLTERTKLPNKECSTIYIRSVLSQRIDEYFSKSLLNEILIELGFNYRINNDSDYYFNISQSDLKILNISSSILKTISKNNNYPFSELVKLHRCKNVDFYKYTFKYLIRCNFKSAFIEKNHTERDVYNVISKELGISSSLVVEYIETFNSPKFQDMPKEILQKLLNLFHRKNNECLTNENYYR